MVNIQIAPADAVAFTVTQGQLLRVVDVEGQQVADFIAVRKGDPSEFSSPGETILFNYPRIRLNPGDKFYSSKQQPMFEIVSDDAKGVHDFLYAACNRNWFESMDLPGHRNCNDNLMAALAKMELEYETLPAPINLFQDTYPQPDGLVISKPAPTRAGEGVTLRALVDCTVAVSSCSYDAEAAETCCNGSGPSPLRVELT